MKHNKIFAFLLAGVLSLGIVGCGSDALVLTTIRFWKTASLPTTRAIWKKNLMPQAIRWIW